MFRPICSAVNESAIYGHSIQFNQEFACKAISELGIDQYQNYNNVPHWLLKNIFAVLYVLFSVLALQPCINFKVFYINFCSFSKRLINEKQVGYSAYDHLEKMHNAKKPIHRFYRSRCLFACLYSVMN
jgi:hypothetical protein